MYNYILYIMFTSRLHVYIYIYKIIYIYIVHILYNIYL